MIWRKKINLPYIVFFTLTLFLLPVLIFAATTTSKIILNPHSDGSWFQTTYSPSTTATDGYEFQGIKGVSNEAVTAGKASLNNSQYTEGTNRFGEKEVTILGNENANKFLSAQQAYQATQAGQAEQNKIDARTAQIVQNPQTPGTGSKVINFFIWLLSFSFYFVSLLVGFLIYIAGMVIDFFFNARQLASSTIVQSGWTFTRDTLNFVFILALLAISFSTIAGIETFQMRKALPSLIFAALLVNFSLAIGGAFLQVSNVITDSIASSILQSEKGNEDGVGTKLTTGLLNSADIKKFYNYGDVPWIKSMTGLKTLTPTEDVTDFQQAMDQDWKDYLSTTIKSALTLVMICIFAVAFIFLAALMAIRLVMLVFLLILSPVPFVFSVIPQAKSYTTMWWDNFIKYVIFLPVVTFFLALAIRLLGKKSGQTPLATEFFKKTPDILTMGGGVAGSIFDMVFIAIFIFAAIMVAKKLGIAGANAALSAAKKTTLGAAKLGMMPTTLGLKGAAATGKAAGLMAGHGAAKVGLMAADATGSGIAKIPYVGGAFRGARTIGRAGQRLYKGQEAREQLAEKEKALAGMSKDEKYAAWNRGNVAAGVSLMKNDDLEKEDYSKLNAQVPKSTEAHNNVQTAWKRKDPINAIMSDDLKSRVSSGSTQPYSKADQDSINELQTAFKKMKPEDYAKLTGEDLRTVIKAGVKIPLTKPQLDATIGSTNTDLQLAVSEHLKFLEKNPALTNPGQKATLDYARNKLKMT